MTSTVPPGGYRCILVDAPWPETGGGRRGAQNHYPLIKRAKDIAPAIMTSGVWAPAGSCHLWMWAPSRTWMAMQVISALGFSQVTFVPWVKVHRDDPTRTVPGLGRYMRHDSELLLFATRGPAQMPDTAYPRQAILTLGSGLGAILASKREHSRKPDEQYDLIEQVSPGPRLEMFARHPRDGWDCWGDEV